MVEASIEVMATRSIWRCSPLFDSAASTRHIAMLSPCGVERVGGEALHQREADAIDEIRQVVAEIEMGAFGHGTVLEKRFADSNADLKTRIKYRVIIADSTIAFTTIAAAL